MISLREVQEFIAPFIGISPETDLNQLKWMFSPWLKLLEDPTIPSSLIALPNSKIPVWHPHQLSLMGSGIVEMVLIQLACQSLPDKPIQQVKQVIKNGNNWLNWEKVACMMGLDDIFDWKKPILQHVVLPPSNQENVEHVPEEMPINRGEDRILVNLDSDQPLINMVCVVVGAVASQAGMEDAIRVTRRCWGQVYMEIAFEKAQQEYDPTQALRLVFESKTIVSKKRVSHPVPVIDHTRKKVYVDPKQPLDVNLVMNGGVREDYGKPPASRPSSPSTNKIHLTSSPTSPQSSTMSLVSAQSLPQVAHLPPSLPSTPSSVPPSVPQQSMHQVPVIPSTPPVSNDVEMEDSPVNAPMMVPTAKPPSSINIGTSIFDLPTENGGPPSAVSNGRTSTSSDMVSPTLSNREGQTKKISGDPILGLGPRIIEPLHGPLQHTNSFEPPPPVESVVQDPGNAKGRLKIHADKRRWPPPVYTVFSTGPPHKPIFECHAVLTMGKEEDSPILEAHATGSNRKMSEQWAAQAIMDQIAGRGL